MHIVGTLLQITFQIRSMFTHSFAHKDNILQNCKTFLTELVYSLLHPEDWHNGSVDLAEGREIFHVRDLHVDLESDLGTQCSPSEGFDVKPEAVFRLNMENMK